MRRYRSTEVGWTTHIITWLPRCLTSPTDNVAVLAAYTHSKQLRVYRLVIEWHVPPQQPKQPPIYPETPTLRARRVKLIPAAYPTENTQNGGKVQLTHLEVLAPTTTLPTAAPTILAVFSCMADERPTYTIVCRWELKDSPSTLHPSFEQLAMRRASISQSQVTEVQPSEWCCISSIG